MRGVPWASSAKHSLNAACVFFDVRSRVNSSNAVARFKFFAVLAPLTSDERLVAVTLGESGRDCSIALNSVVREDVLISGCSCSHARNVATSSAVSVGSYPASLAFLWSSLCRPPSISVSCVTSTRSCSTSDLLTHVPMSRFGGPAQRRPRELGRERVGLLEVPPCEEPVARLGRAPSTSPCVALRHFSNRSTHSCE